MQEMTVVTILTLSTINMCGIVYIGSNLLKLICKVIHYMNLLDKENNQ